MFRVIRVWRASIYRGDAGLVPDVHKMCCVPHRIACRLRRLRSLRVRRVVALGVSSRIVNHFLTMCLHREVLHFRISALWGTAGSCAARGSWPWPRAAQATLHRGRGLEHCVAFAANGLLIGIPLPLQLGHDRHACGVRILTIALLL